MTRSFVPFEALWEMAIDVPYSFLVRDEAMAWSCGQLALDKNSQVVGPNDIATQSRVVCDYIEEILGRGGVSAQSVTKLLLYYVHTGEPDRQKLLEIFRDRFGTKTLLVPICVPHYYYEGVLLEVDVFCDDNSESYISQIRNGIAINAVSTDAHSWVSLESDASTAKQAIPELISFLQNHDLKPEAVLSEHWFVPDNVLNEFEAIPDATWPGMDRGALTNSGPKVETINAHFLISKTGVTYQEQTIDEDHNLSLLVRQDEDLTWLQARSLNGNLGLVAQTEAIMKGISTTISRLGLKFTDVVKSTTHYVGGSSAEELHDNMQVRNAYYEKPGPASTGLPVFGFSDNSSRMVVDLTFRN